MDKETLDLLAAIELGKVANEELIQWAIASLERGIESQSLILLAGLLAPESGGAIELFKKSIAELGIHAPSSKELMIYQAKHIAQQIMHGEIPPSLGCAQIGEIAIRLDWPNELAEFTLLSHEQTEHENLGITSESVKDAIFEAAKKLSLSAG